MSIAAGKSNHSVTGMTHPLMGNVRSLVDGCVEANAVLWQNG